MKGNPNTGQEGQESVEKEMPTAYIKYHARLTQLQISLIGLELSKLEDGTKVRFFKSNNEVVDI